MAVNAQKQRISLDSYLPAWEELLEVHDHLQWEVDEKRQVWVGQNDAFEREIEVRPPLPFPSIKRTDILEEYLDQFDPLDIPTYGMFIMQAGAGALGYFEDGKVVFHKAIKKYMVRAKRGKSQISYLNTRGKSKAGSRIRLANTDRFIEEINGYLNQWDEYDPPEFWLYSCPVSLWGMLFAADPPPPFEKDDPHIKKLPFDVNKPDFAELQRINSLSLEAEIRRY
ncbi:MAG: hypothetical protein AB8F95_06880 [Bacteroidia bacterium]